MYKYRKNENLYELYDEETGDILYSGETVGIIFDYGEGNYSSVLLKHGDPKSMNKWLDKMKKACSDMGTIDYQLMMVDGPFDIEDLNKVLDTTNYLDKFLTKYYPTRFRLTFIPDDDFVK